MAVRIEVFDPGLHDTNDFRSGSDSQDNFLRRTAKRQQRDGYTRLYIATDATQVDEPRACLGFYAINAHAIGVADVPFDAAPRPPRSNLIPGVFLSVAGTAGEAERARLHSFYASMGFRPLPGRPERLFLSLSALPPQPIGRIRHQMRRCFLLQPVIVASTFSRCHGRGPRPWVQPQRR